MNFHPNKLYFKLCKTFQDKVTPETKAIIGNEGSSRSSKTWDTFHFIVAFCDANRDNPQDIYVLRDTLVNCRDFTLHEWIECLKVIGIFSESNLVQSPKPVYNLFGHKIKFRGLDEKKSEGYPSDILFFNEVLEMQEQAVMGLIMRCRKFVIMDWNPKYTEHWVFKMEKREDTIFTRSTFRDNRHLQRSVVKEIESYSPWMFEDMHLPENERRPHKENIENGTADIFRWKVYGLGERANKEGLVFPNVTWIDEFPEDIEEYTFGMDFGETAQTAIVKVGVKRKPNKSDIYIKKLFYAPTESSNLIADVLTVIKSDELKWLKQLAEKRLGRELVQKEIEELRPLKHIWCDNNQPGWVGDLRRAKFMALLTKKFPGSREYWQATIKKFNIHLVRDIDLRREQENFCYRVVDGKQLSEDCGEYDHLWSAAGYATVGEFRIDKEVPDKK